MALVNLRINGKVYTLGCEDGGERQLEALAEIVDAKARLLAGEAGPGETRLMMLVALTLADELQEAGARLNEAQARIDNHAEVVAALEDKAAKALETAARRIEALGSEWGGAR